MNHKERIGIFVGSFDPFTIGHDSVVKRALPLFDHIVIGVGVNSQKSNMLSEAERIEAITKLYANEPKISVKVFHDLAVDFAKREGATYIIKGVRSVKDFEYEREQADINSHISGIDTIFLFTEPQLASVSSSMVRELLRYGRDVKEFLPVAPKSDKP